MTTVTKISKGVYASEESLCAIGWNGETNRFESRCYDRETGELFAMFSHTTKLILVAKPALNFVGG